MLKPLVYHFTLCNTEQQQDGAGFLQDWSCCLRDYDTYSSHYIYEIANEKHIFHGQKDPEETLKCVSVLQKWNISASQITE